MVVIVMIPTFISVLVGKQSNAIKICLNGCRIKVFSHGFSINDGYCSSAFPFLKMEGGRFPSIGDLRQSSTSCHGVGTGLLTGVGVTMIMGVGPEAGGAGSIAIITNTNRTAPKLTTSIICDQRNQSSFFLTIDSNFCLICCQAPTFISFRFRSKCILGTNTFVAQKRLISQKTIGRKKSSKIKWPETGKLSATICLRRSLKAKTAK